MLLKFDISDRLNILKFYNLSSINCWLWVVAPLRIIHCWEVGGAEPSPVVSILWLLPNIALVMVCMHRWLSELEMRAAPQPANTFTPRQATRVKCLF